MHKKRFQRQALCLGIALAATALESSSLTLGRAEGTAWIGQPLDLVVPMQMEPGQRESPACMEAEVFHGDLRQEPGRIQVQVLATEQPESFRVRISSGAPVNEPVVTVYLHAGCGREFSRKYVVLADLADSAGASSRLPAPMLPQNVLRVAAPPIESPAAPEPVPLPVPPPAPAPVALAPPAPAPKPAASAVPAPPPKPASAPSKPVAAPSAAPPGPVEKQRLRLDAIGPSTDLGAAGASQQASATSQMQALQKDLKALLEQATQNESRIQEMRDRLEQAESHRVPASLAYGLAALLALCLGALAYVLGRRKRQD